MQAVNLHGPQCFNLLLPPVVRSCGSYPGEFGSIPNGSNLLSHPLYHMNNSLKSTITDIGKWDFYYYIGESEKQIPIRIRTVDMRELKAFGSD